ncbi:MAG: biopolymer transporter ExbD [Nitrospinota bacterium]|nr:biopolymer transporter ExbD [Nitrospinota bacterium]
MIRFPYKEKSPFKLDLIPMINVVFLLLIFFMLTSTTTLQTKKVELPTAKTAEKNSKQFLIMTIDKNGSLELDGKAVTMEALPVHLEKKVGEKKNTVISIHADKVIEFELFGKVIELAKQAGAEDFMLATENDRSDKDA